MVASLCLAALVAIVPFASAALSTQAYTWKSVKVGGGGGFVPGIVFNPTEKGLAYARTDIGGLYKLNADDTWTALTDFADNAHWNYWGVDALATDPVDTKRVYIATGMYTNSWDPNNGQIMRSSDYGKTWSSTVLPFKVGGNMPGRGLGERLGVDPNKNSVLFFGARSGNGLWKSTDYGVTWSKVSTFTNTGTYVADPSDTNGYNSDKTGIAWITFDKSSGSSGTATPRIFVGVANVGSASVFVSNDAGATWSAVAGQNTTFMPHRGVISPSEKALYVTYNNNAGPYDGTSGAVAKYYISNSTWVDITPVSGSDLYFGFGGLAVDAKKPGTIMVAAVNSWWPDGQIFRSTNGGATWSKLWDWASYPSMNRYYKYDTSLAPWISIVDSTDTKQIGWMMESLEIDPFDSDHWLYGTGVTIYGGRDLTKWDTVHNITLKSLADGIEEFAVQSLVSPPTGPSLMSAIFDVGGFVHSDFNTAPKTMFTNPRWASTVDIDFAGNKPTNLVRVGNSGTDGTKQIALSTDSGASWNQDYGAPDGNYGGKVALSADGDTVLWRNDNGTRVSRFTNAFTAVTGLTSNAVIASDKKNNTIFYAASGSKFYISTNNGVSFTATAGSLGSSTAPVKIVVNLNTSGDLWVSTDKGLFHSTNFGATFTADSSVTAALAIGLGAPKTAGGYPALYIAGTIGGVIGYYRTDDQGANWVQINDATHGFGAASANPLTADPRIYGRVYIGTNGRGIFYGDVAGSTTTPTTAVSSTAATSTTRVSTTTITSAANTSTTSRASSTTTSAAAGATASPYAQCGGQGWTGPTICTTGWTCVASNSFYSQCLQV
ncbi:glycoside hydrolase family 74 protein [Rhizoctonia solani 123E]|uniref:Glycoside hydrolase family 74 protein n=1 Tax=Rhizoctonia solani 123E TaxID=1423351 RepID=A0A074RY34_9AGAM|nr:glycoside hydrolase family 74 protein [Rhizoctonia solani 123E]